MNMLKKLFYFFLTLFFLACLGVSGGYYWYVIVHPGPEISIENIQSILGKESPVFYNDGETRLGVFFNKAHRQYVEYDEIPQTFVNALIASEDNRFFSHFGFDLVGISRAAIRNVQARRVVQGGSTLTQQTAKNLFERRERSYKAKLIELLFALRLEFHYTKEKIFEFYANQFYVSGNGHGLGVAARYYFDKLPQELTLMESAFIAGSVKRPNYYNPFIKKTNSAARQAQQRAKVRVEYVLSKMLELQMISRRTYNKTLAEDIQFKKGQVGYALDYVMESVKDAVASDELIEAMEHHGIRNISTSGIRLITTVDYTLQQKTLYALRRELSRLDVRLLGYERDEVQKTLKNLDYKGDTAVREGAFLFGIIKKTKRSKDAGGLEVYFGRKLGGGLIDKDGLTRMVNARVKWKKNAWSTATKKDYTELLTQFKENDRVWVSVRTVDPDGEVLLDLEKYPEIQGGAIVLKDGAIKAMAGGVENRFFNRALHAKRTMGSAFKPFLFAAALQLGWNSTDMLSNTRNVFVFQNQPYFPRPDHKSPHQQVSMSWAGVKSENVASVWLLAHLCDQLNDEQFNEVAGALGLAPKVVDGEHEPYRNYRARIRDRYGIVINQSVLKSAAYTLAIKNLETDFIFEDRMDEYRLLQKLPYGRGFSKFNAQIDSQLADPGGKLKGYERKELLLRKKLLKNNFLSFLALRNELKGYIQGINNSWGRYTTQTTVDDNLPAGQLYYDRGLKRYVFAKHSSLPAHLQRVDRQKLRNYLKGQNSSGRKRFWDSVYLDSLLSVAAVDMTSRQIGRQYSQLKEKSPYSLEVLSAVDDFRKMVGLQYLIQFAKNLGIRAPLEPVLSFPLGSNVVTLFDATRMYEGLVTGKVSFYGEGREEDADVLAIIDRIESAEGKLLYRPEKKTKRVIDNKTTLSVGHILENTIKFGTGRFADKHVKLLSGNADSSQELAELELSVPLLGKTGTANRYTNASFFGYLPGLSNRGDSMAIEGGYGVGVYVGYDNNMAMRRGATKITGAAGALPSWSEIVQSVIINDHYGDKLDPVDLSFYGLTLERAPLGQYNLAVAGDQGGQLSPELQKVDARDRYKSTIMTFGRINDSGIFERQRQFTPYFKMVQETLQ